VVVFLIFLKRHTTVDNYSVFIMLAYTNKFLVYD